MIETNEIVLRSDSDADILAQSLIQDELEIKDINVKFDGWPTVRIHLNGPQFNQTITAGVMRKLLEAQKAINQAYCLIQYGHQDTRVLTQDERDSLELIVHVGEGSSDLELNFADLLNKFVEGVAGNMTSEHALYAILGVAMVGLTGFGFRAFLNQRKEIRLAEIGSQAKESELATLKALRQQDQQIFDRACQVLEKSPKQEGLYESIGDINNSFLKASSSATSSEIQGVDLSSGVVSELNSSVRDQAKELRLDGNYKVKHVDSSAADGFKVKIESEDGLVLVADVQEGTINKANQNGISRAEWKKTTVRLIINAREYKGRITKATIIDIDPS